MHTCTFFVPKCAQSNEIRFSWWSTLAWTFISNKRSKN